MIDGRTCFDIPIHCLQAADIHAKATRDRRANLLGIELFSFDLTALEHIFDQRL